MTAGRPLPLSALMGAARRARLDTLMREARRREGSMAKRWPTEMLRKGTRLFHGTRTSTTFETIGRGTPRGPAWFSTERTIAESFVDWHAEAGTSHFRRVLVYEVEKNLPRLARVANRGDMRAFMERFGVLRPCGAEEMAEAMAEQDRFEGWRIPENYVCGGDDILIVAPERWLRLVDVQSVRGRP